MRDCRCSCGAAGDQGEMIEHTVTALSGPGGGNGHDWLTGDEPEQVAAARQARARRDEVRRRLAEAAGVSVDELREVLR